jgi:hypothetical protein
LYKAQDQHEKLGIGSDGFGITGKAALSGVFIFTFL